MTRALVLALRGLCVLLVFLAGSREAYSALNEMTFESTGGAAFSCVGNEFEAGKCNDIDFDLQAIKIAVSYRESEAIVSLMPGSERLLSETISSMRCSYSGSTYSEPFSVKPIDFDLPMKGSFDCSFSSTGDAHFLRMTVNFEGDDGRIRFAELTLRVWPKTYVCDVLHRHGEDVHAVQPDSYGAVDGRSTLLFLTGRCVWN